MGQYITAVDFGTTKTAVAVGEKSSVGVRITAFSEAPSKGILRGDVLNISAVKKILCDLITDVEEQMQDKQENFKVRKLYVGISGANIHCEITNVSRTRKEPSRTIERYEVEGMLAEAYKSFKNENEVVLHVIPQSYNVDDLRGLTDIEGHQGTEIMGLYVVFIGRNDTAEHTKAVITKAGYQVGKLVLEPFATAQSVLTDEEMELGTALVDIGGGTTDLLIYKDNRVRYSAVIPFGGNSITQDIRQVCTVTERHAERMKCKYGSCLSSLGADNKFLGITDDNGIITKRVPFRQFFETIEARAEEIIATVKHEIKEAGMDDQITKIVLTGGTASLNQLSVLFRQMTGYSVRQAFPNEKKILSTSCPQIFNYSSSTVAGLVLKGFEYEELEEETEQDTVPVAEQPAVEKTEPVQPEEKTKKKTIFSGLFGKGHTEEAAKPSEQVKEVSEQEKGNKKEEEKEKKQKTTLFDDFFNEEDDKA